MSPSSKILMSLISVYFFCTLSTALSEETLTKTENKPRTPDEQRLIEELFIKGNYDSSARPVFNAAHNVEITFGFTLIKIMDMEEKNQVLVTTAWLEMDWVDERISWDPKDYNDLKLIRIPADLLWLPDIVLYNNADDYTTGFMSGKAMVNFDGSVFWGPPARFRSSCLVNINYFPFDTQRCTLKFGSWTYPADQVDILNKRPHVDVTRYVSNGEWQLTGYTTTRYETVYPGPGNVTYSDVKVVLVIQRRILYYIMNILFSCIWLSFLTLLDFCLPPDEGEKITLGTTLLLSYAFFMLLVANSVPPSGDSLPLLGIYLTVSLAVNSASLSMTILVLKLHHSPAHSNRVPPWARLFVLQYLARMVRCQCIPCDKTTTALPRKPDRNVPDADKNVCKALITKTITWTDVGETALSESARDDLGEPSDVGESTPLNRSRRASFSEARQTSVIVRELVVNHICKYLGFLSSGAEDSAARQSVNSEWKQMALVVDRFLFWIFLTVTLISTINLLLIIPSTRVAEDDQF